MNLKKREPPLLIFVIFESSIQKVSKLWENIFTILGNLPLKLKTADFKNIFDRFFSFKLVVYLNSVGFRDMRYEMYCTLSDNNTLE